MNIKRLISFCIVFILILGVSNIAAQCPMCRIAAESNLENGGSAGQGLNKGILYMLCMPYILIGTLAFVWIRNRRNRDAEEAHLNLEREINTIS